MSLDATLLLWINQGWADPGLDFLFHWVSGRTGFSFPLLGLLLLLFWRRFGRDGLKLWLLMLLGLSLGDLLGNVLKAFFAEPRPCFDLYAQLRPPGGGPPRQCSAPVTGMPSSHALNFFAAAAFVAYALRNLRLSLLFWGIAILVGISRIYLGKHYPSQVLSGAVIGLLYGVLWVWSGLHSFAFGRRILSAVCRQDSGGVPQGVVPKGFLAAGKRSQALTWSQPIVWLPLTVAVLLFGWVWVADLNEPLFRFLNSLGPISADGLWANLTLLGDALVVIVLASLLLRQRMDIIGALLLAALFASLWVHGLKPWVAHPRPLAVLGEEQVHLIGHALKNSSFPSGHTATAFTLAGVVVLRGVQPLLAGLLLLVAILAALSRSVVGVHWPLDLLAGMFGGWLSAALGVWLAQRWPLRPGPWLRLLLLLFFGGAAIALLITRGLGYPQAIPLQMLIGLTSLLYLMNYVWEHWPLTAGAPREGGGP
jgi:membrane-associated phospholipid phosphatase